MLQSIATVESEHERCLKRGDELRQAAQEAAVQQRKQRDEEDRIRRDEERRERNRRTKMRFKMAKADRELERRIELEEYRWNRKHGIQM